MRHNERLLKPADRFFLNIQESFLGNGHNGHRGGGRTDQRERCWPGEVAPAVFPLCNPVW